MTLAEGQSNTPWEIIATDTSTSVLDIARSGHYEMERAHNIPQPLLEKYCLKGTGEQEGTFLMDQLLRKRIQFMQVNLNNSLPKMGEFHVIFLRNAMIYFDMETKRKVISGMLPMLKQDGIFLFSAIQKT